MTEEALEARRWRAIAPVTGRNTGKAYTAKECCAVDGVCGRDSCGVGRAGIGCFVLAAACLARRLKRRNGSPRLQTSSTSGQNPASAKPPIMTEGTLSNPPGPQIHVNSSEAHVRASDEPYFLLLIPGTGPRRGELAEEPAPCKTFCLTCHQNGIGLTKHDKDSIPSLLYVYFLQALHFLRSLDSDQPVAPCIAQIPHSRRCN